MRFSFWTNELSGLYPYVRPNKRRPLRRGTQQRPLAFRPQLEVLEDRLAPAIRTWDGGGADNNWTTAANWDNDIVVAAGDQLVFPEVIARTANVNNFPAGTSFDKISFLGNGYSITGNAITLGSQGLLDTSGPS